MLDEQTGVSVSRKGTQRTGVNGDGWGMTVTGADYTRTLRQRRRLALLLLREVR
jgi:predicted glutamine amidotransferase